MGKKGRPTLRNKSHSCYVRVPYEIDQVLSAYCDRSGKSISKVILEALKDFLGIEQG